MTIWAVFVTAHIFAGLGCVKTGLTTDVVVKSVCYCPGIQTGWNNMKFAAFYPSEDIVRFCRNFRSFSLSMAFTFLIFFK